MYRGETLRLTDLQMKFRQNQTSHTFTPLDFKEFIPAGDNALSKESDGKPVGLGPGAVAK